MGPIDFGPIVFLAAVGIVVIAALFLGGCVGVAALILWIIGATLSTLNLAVATCCILLGGVALAGIASLLKGE